MYSSILLSATALLAAGVAIAQNPFSVATATIPLVQCQPYSITWTGGTAPYYPSIVMGGDISNVLKRFQETNSMSQLWNVDLPVGITVQFIIGDSAGNSAPSAISSSAIAAGNSDDCLNGSSSSTGAAVGGSSTVASSSAASSSSVALSSATSSTAPSSSSTSSTRSSITSSNMSPTAAAPSTPANNDDNGAMNLRGGAALAAGLVGVIAAALI